MHVAIHEDKAAVLRRVIAVRAHDTLVRGVARRLRRRRRCGRRRGRAIAASSSDRERGKKKESSDAHRAADYTNCARGAPCQAATPGAQDGDAVHGTAAQQD
jgi:hypothetical protein